MRYSLATLLAIAATSQALSFHDIRDFGSRVLQEAGRGPRAPQGPPPGVPAPPPNGVPRAPPGNGEIGNCPAVWQQVAKELSTSMVSDGQCNDMARGAIRAAFHDCGTWDMTQGTTGGCDGSLYLAKEYTREENRGLQDIVPKIGALAEKYKVGVADMIQFAGASAVKLCPGGPTVRTMVGRKDSSTPNPEGNLPNVHAPGDDLVALFNKKGISAVELAALVGAHTASKQNLVDPAKAGAPQDTTPGKWDVEFYSQTLDKTAPFTFPSDQQISMQRESGPAFKSFARNQFGWTAAFSGAMTHLSLLGVASPEKLTDCTTSLPGGSRRRDVKAAPINGRAV
ncbi:class II peroxidase [Aulographum hederae CBS 113979]|uniref:Peroxidase n=1 Tax=Aulographum hederae CBS 113979 TaxID=1176131 RepID=A0A6G1GS13_9PEZI|nr:class II peroxidase [Aulographum hederae CBS 113979]